LSDIQSERQINWQYLLSPSSIAVIGASNTPGSWGYNAVKGLPRLEGRRIYPVNPNATEILGVKSYRSVTDIPDTVDLAVIVVTNRLVPMILRECVSKGVKAAVIISSGFAEMGDSGRKLEAELAEIAEQGGINFIGPNSLGHADTRSQLSTFGQPGEMTAGPVAVLSQSGNMCMKIVRNLAASGVTFSKYISTGNEANLYMEDYLEYLAKDNETRIIAAYIEGLRDGRRFLRLAKEITASKPMVVVKAGGTKESARAVMSHTGALAGADEVYTAAFKQSGVIRVEDDDELCDVVYTLLNGPLPQSNRVGIVSIGGGPAAMATEACEKEGLVLGTLEESTVKRLDSYLPPRWPRRNPVDMAGPSAAEFSRIDDLLCTLLEDANIDAVFMLAPVVMDKTFLTGRLSLSPQQVKAYRKKEEENLKSLGEKLRKYEKPVFSIWPTYGFGTGRKLSSLLRRARIILQPNAGRAARTMHHLVWYRQYLDATKGK
jgi:acyl-CoA synthetase (NDP forming)